MSGVSSGSQGSAEAERPAEQQRDGESAQGCELGQDLRHSSPLSDELFERIVSPSVWGQMSNGSHGVGENLKRHHASAERRKGEPEWNQSSRLLLIA